MTVAYILLGLYFTSSYLYASKTPCDLTNDECFTKSFTVTLPEIAAGIPTLGVKSSDPVFLEKVTGVFPKFMYIFTNTTFEGYKNCKVTNVTLKLERSRFIFHILCPSLDIRGNYEMHGDIFGMFINGKGNATIITENIHMQVNAEIKRYKSENGKEHMILRNIKTDMLERTHVSIIFEHINKDNDELAAKILKRLNDNWLAASKLAEGPVFRSSMKIFVENINSYLRRVPLNELFYEV